MLIDQNPASRPDQVKAKLMRTAWRGFPATMTIAVTTPSVATYTENADIFTIGAGQVDIWAAYNDTSLPSGSAGQKRIGSRLCWRAFACLRSFWQDGARTPPTCPGWAFT
jgi:predicted Rdx family selenoprotein